MDQDGREMDGEGMRALRVAAKLTQGQLAARLGLTPQYVSMMEKGRRGIDARTARAIMHETGPYHLLTPAPPVPAALAREAEKLIERLGAALGDPDAECVGVIRAAGGQWLRALRKRAPD